MADTLNKSDLVAKIAAETNQSQATVASVVDSFFNVVAESVGSGTKVAIPGWISFEPDRRQQGREGLGRQQAQGRRQVVQTSRWGIEAHSALVPLRHFRGAHPPTLEGCRV